MQVNGQMDYGHPPGQYGYDQYASQPPGQYYQPQEVSPARGGAAFDTQGSYMQTGYTDPMASGMHAQYQDMDYKQFTEQAGKTTASSAGGGRKDWPKIDQDSGVAPRRCTDLVCVALFILYVIGICIFLLVVKNKTVDGRPYGDVRRLTHGMDYEARLCGIDEGVEAKPYLFWCRADPYSPTEQNFANTPAALNLDHPVCVSQCPSLPPGAVNQTGPAEVECLMQAETPGQNGAIVPVPANTFPSGQFGNVQNYFLSFEEKTLYTHTYETHLLTGRFCVPTDSTLKASVLSGPLKMFPNRLLKGAGSFQDCWLAIFIAILVVIVLSYPYIFLIGACKYFGSYIVTTCVILVWVSVTLACAFFGLAVVDGKPIIQNYEEINVFYLRNNANEAKYWSYGCAGVLLIMSFGSLSYLLNLTNDLDHMHDLTDAAFKALQDMKSLYLVPPLLAVARFFTTWIVCYNSMTLLSVGTFDDYRIVVEGEPFQGMSKSYGFDHWMGFGILIYAIGGIWAVETITSLGQFLISYCTVLYYFTPLAPPDDDEYEVGGQVLVKQPIPFAAWKGLFAAFRYHLGSILLGGSGIWFFRIFRMTQWVKVETVLHQKSSCGECVPLSSLNPCVACIGGACDRLSSCLGLGASPAERKKQGLKTLKNYPWATEYCKDAYNDVNIRAQHFLEAMPKAQGYINSQEGVKAYYGICRPVTVVGVLAAGIAGALISYLVMNSGAYNDPTSSGFIQDPILACIVAFFVCGSVAYDFCALLDHTADTLLYCFAYNKKFNKKTCYKFAPRNIRDLVGFDGIKDSTYGYYGTARPGMYLTPWLNSAKQGTAQAWTTPPQHDGAWMSPEEKAAIAAARSGAGTPNSQMASQMGSQYGAGYAGGSPYANQGSTTGGFPTAGYGGYQQ